MNIDSVGAVEFEDLDSLQASVIGVSRLPNGGVALWMDQNNTGVGGWGGDCEVGFDGAAAQRFLQGLRAAKRLADSGPKKGWEPIDPFDYSYCDQDDEVPSTPGRLGYVSLLARRGVVRLIIVPRREVENFLF